jgi:AAA15 family ATPase/GTPase
MLSVKSAILRSFLRDTKKIIAFLLAFRAFLVFLRKIKGIMVIDKIKIAGIMNLEEISISLRDFNALIAPNNYGKTNVLNAIGFGIEFMEASFKRKSSLMKLRSLIPINNRLEGKPFIYEIEGVLDRKGRTWNFVYGYSFEWAKTIQEDAGACIVAEYLRLKSDEDLKYKSYINRTETGNALYLASPTGRCSKQLLVADNVLALNKLANFDDLFYVDIIRELNRIDVRMINTLDNPDGYFNMITPDEDVNELSLDFPREGKIGFYINSLKAKSKEKYDLLKNTVVDLLPNMEDFKPVQINLKKDVEHDENKVLPFRLPEIFYDVQVKEYYNNQYTSINRISTGCKKILYILTMVIAANINKIPLLLLEELENSVHPRLLQNLLASIRTLAGDTKIITTSHSPYLIKYLDPRQIKLGVPSADGIADFRGLKSTKIGKLLRNASAEEVSLGEYLFEMMLDMDDNKELSNEYLSNG